MTSTHSATRCDVLQVILSSAKLNSRLPRAISAFFVLNEHDAHFDPALKIDTVQAHSDYLAEYGLTAEQVPLLMLTPDNWEAPFAIFEPRRG